MSRSESRSDSMAYKPPFLPRKVRKRSLTCVFEESDEDVDIAPFTRTEKKKKLEAETPNHSESSSPRCHTLDGSSGREAYRDSQQEGKQPFVSQVGSSSFAISLNLSLIRGDHERSNSVGVIEKIQLQDFMCHTQLDIHLGPRVNFIVGQNGSKLQVHLVCVPVTPTLIPSLGGKSAIFAAILVALGAKVPTSQPLNQLIRNGCRCTSVQVMTIGRLLVLYKLWEEWSSLLLMILCLPVYVLHISGH